MRLRHHAAVITAVAGIALTGIATAAPAMAATNASASVKAGTAARPFSLEGALTALNAAKSTLTVNGSAVSVAPTATVTVDGNTSKLAKLPIGANVKLSGNVTDGANVATKVEATTTLPFLSAGSVDAVDAAAMTITVKGLTPARVLPVAAKAAITLDGRTVALSALPVRSHILVTGTVTGGVYSAKSLTAVSRWALNLNGTVSAVDAVAGTVTVNSGTGTAVKLNVDPKATIKVNGVKVSLADLPIGATVALSGSETPVAANILGIDAKANVKR